jgi:hypothetical protein
MHVQKQKHIQIQQKAATAIEGGNNTRQTLNNTIDFQDKIDKKIRKYSNLASGYNTRGKYDLDINLELRDHLKMDKRFTKLLKKT